MSTPCVLYMGYGSTGTTCLDALLGAGLDVAGVFCRASDREERPDDESSVFSLARRRGLHLFAETDPNAPAFVEVARALSPDLLISVQYDRILKPPLLAVPRHGAYNLHFGPLPRLRGCFPTKWAILDDEPGGVTFHSIDPGIDSGAVLAQTVVPLAEGETDQSLYTRLAQAGEDLFRQQIPWLRSLTPPPALPQDEARASYHPRRLPFDGIIDWRRDAAWVERFIRAFTFPPYPAAKTWYEGGAIELRAPVGLSGDLPGLEPGEWLPLDDGRIAVQCGSGSIIAGTFLLGGQEVPASRLRTQGPGRPRFRGEAS
ncbi:MAG TPA: methionyl-tRNA formyltransferase [Thermoanaerobaculia bacterium]|nr:methionyl-tRNA formyltransferase [Thermoanaerobaculia bacterium]